MADARRRNTLRYPGYDYGSPGAVFVTICTAQRQRLFGEVRQGVMCPNDAGEAVLGCWRRLPDRFPDLALDEVILMPDHLHAIVFLGTDPASGPKRHLLGDAVRSFKAATLRAWSSGVRVSGWQSYDGDLWQRGFYDTILNPERPIDVVRDYILANPARWQAKQDSELPYSGNRKKYPLRYRPSIDRADDPSGSAPTRAGTSNERRPSPRRTTRLMTLDGGQGDEASPPTV